MKVACVLAAAVAVCFSISPLESFAKEKSKPAGKGIKGKFSKIKDGKVVVENKPDHFKTFVVGEKTKFKVNGKFEINGRKAALGDLEAGMKIVLLVNAKTKVLIYVDAAHAEHLRRGRHDWDDFAGAEGDKGKKRN